MIDSKYPSKVLITGGREVGGLASFAEALREGFSELGIPAEIIAPSRILSHWRELRDPNVLNILSTTAVFAAPFARRTICVAHGFPRADVQGWLKLAGIVSSFKVAEACSQLVAVSHYTAIHLRTIFNLRVDAVIHNPLNPTFLQESREGNPERSYVTFVGRLHPSKKLDRLLPAICDLVDETLGLDACIIGEGESRAALERSVKGNPRIAFKGSVSSESVRYWLRRTRLFVSGCETEALGICYLEALSQGCIVAMPACGGGLEIAPDEIGKSVRLLPLSLDRPEVLQALRNALLFESRALSLTRFHAKTVASSYLTVDSLRRSPEHYLGYETYKSYE